MSCILWVEHPLAKGVSDQLVWRNASVLSKAVRCRRSVDAPRVGAGKKSAGLATESASAAHAVGIAASVRVRRVQS